MNYVIDDKKEIEDSLIDSFKMQIGSSKNMRKDIAKAAKAMRDQLGKKRDAVTKEYIQVLDKIIKEYSKAKTVKQIQDEIDKGKFSK